ncbi:type I methionyl aminopeptidase [Erysipelothrix rhusiopathiae]|uniref:type I methionyl aminopeptidase n=1 Tax=Erysipelothrix rhusiopathiae TaxID=1648 RepID=UPI001EDFF38C|nr:type I methionyl aminopeptidase [Erysipelothrix rhusiopathiae]MCG4436251.1 type I methionyl aminopeptidase [Erysipelothrix rhusiopathiae]MDE8071793.1 type I methionyl aminopeptidase [Erysipelothrix rhusiopathiae]MDE8119625.1 type I methionyl aminopeptidase [Erysipelothrix rhusiopathiae]MDE8132154.1 type I methionyl aminopeptidase [Erysipelothrix rhusiopathiae]MDE8147759.1 type I methionyl aminopeptidase [Erysipelothrix rhusiopathiae]
MISTKSERELELMREAGRIAFECQEAVKAAIQPGVSTKHLDDIARNYILSQGATPAFLGYDGFPGSICASVNEVLVHGIPSSEVILKNGDIITIDVGAIYKGYYSDHAWTYPVGEISDEVQNLLKVTEESLFAGIEAAVAGNRIGDIGHAVMTVVQPFGYGLPVEYSGHGVGTSMHEAPYVPNVGVPNKGALLRKNMVIAIEPMVQIGTNKTSVLDDEWTVVSEDRSLTAHFEHTVVILEDSYEILTRTKEAFKHS